MKNPSLVGNSTSSKGTPCCSKVGIKRGPWTPEEDEVLANYIKREGEGRWRTLPKRAGLLRCGKSCRLRWMNYLRPSVKRGRIAPDEEDLILRLHRLLGNRWSLIAGRIPGRTDNEIKNYWNTHLSKKLISQGIDPRTHKPLNLITHKSPQINHDHVPKSNPSPPIPNPSQSQNQQVDKSMEKWKNTESATLIMAEPSSHGNEGDHMENCNEDMFSSFLDSLINENLLVNQHPEEQQPNNLVAPAAAAAESSQNLCHGDMWETELISAMVGFGNEPNSFNNHYHYLHQL
ncbi:hypothetical protein GOBAR_AA18628 [Gossypium barbadense]|uniref:Uncharacterized protein n=1 Tax=Gossypium barbadense TaxID=3634 RepID=A0A2P5XFA2_GOSBA|nr:hypothetical protein GOBAR_AA18628 [Gossypium barbadense]